jgi:glycosyltransferase involved in cell wall biosynthesis
MFREEQTLIHPRGLFKTFAKEIALRQLFRSGYGLYIGSESKRWFEHYGVPPDRLFAVPYCVDNDRLARQQDELPSDQGALKRSFGLAEDQPVFLVVSRLVPKKQPLAILEAFRRARQNVECSLLIVGSGELEGAMRDEIARRRIPDVSFAGFLDQKELPRAYGCADVFTLFSARDETWGVVVNEAMNFGLPILASDKVGSARDLVQNGRNGYAIASDRIELLAERMIELAGNPEIRQLMGEASKEIVAAWNYDVAADGLLGSVAAAVGPERWARAN